MMLTLMSWKTESGSSHRSPLTVHHSPFSLPSDTTSTAKDTTNTAKASTQVPKDTSVAYTDTLEELSVKADKDLRVVDVINKSLNNGLTQPKQKSVSDIIGKKATDYIMHPFAWKERKKEKKHKIQMDKLRSDLLRDFSLEFVGIGANKSASKENIPVSVDMSDEKFMRKTMKVSKENLANCNVSVADLSGN